MNPEELWETTLNPDNRTMLRVQYSKGTKEKSKEDQKMIKILMGDEVAPRKEFITNNALRCCKFRHLNSNGLCDPLSNKREFKFRQKYPYNTKIYCYFWPIYCNKYCFLFSRTRVSYHQKLRSDFLLAYLQIFIYNLESK